MVWSRRVEDMIYHIFYVYDIPHKEEQMKKLKSVCMNEINSTEGLKEELKEDKSLEYFIIQTALQSIA